MRVVDSIQRLGPWGTDRVFSDVLEEVLADAGLADWRSRPILSGGGVVLQVDREVQSGREVVAKKVYPAGSDTTIGGFLATALAVGVASGAPIMSATVAAGRRVIIAMYTYVDVVTYVCPSDQSHTVFPDVGMFCPVDGQALVLE